MPQVQDFSSIESIRSLVKKEKVDIGLEDDISILKNPLEAGELFFPNRLAIQPLEFADADSKGAPTFSTIKRYVKYAEGCAGLIWFEATSIEFPYARTHGSMLLINRENLPKYKKLLSKVKEASKNNLRKNGLIGRAQIVLQLSHAGRNRHEKTENSPALAFRDPKFDELSGLGSFGRVMEDEEYEELGETFLNASNLAYEAGFDAVDVKACHGYLLNEMLASYKRKGKYGGEPFENRSRFILDTIKKIISETGGVVTSRLSAYDGIPYPYGFGVAKEESEKEGLPAFDPTEPIKLLRKMRSAGVNFVNISLGNPHINALVSRPFTTSAMGGGIEHPLKGVERHFKIVHTLKKAVPKMLFMGAGYSWLRQYSFNAAAQNISRENVDIAGWGRLAIASTDFPKKVLQRSISDVKICINCSSCIKLLRAEKQVGCVVHDKSAKDRLQRSQAAI
jgi:2,4-dienoyl-CoA reductase-like NADH-dependent reductase (Old Yellow Enzyme family)